MALPTIIVDINDLSFIFFCRCCAIYRGVCAGLIVIALIIGKLSLKVGSSPEKYLIQKLSAYASDQPLHERVRNWNMGNGLDFFNLQYSQIGLPSVVQK